jgi:hemerythrin HHE cation binding domain-containing protein
MAWEMQLDHRMRSVDDLRSELARPKRGVTRFAADRHRELAAACDQLLAVIDDPHGFDARRRELDAEVRAHLAAEEELIIPAFQLADPEEGDALATEHARIRAALDALAATPRRAVFVRELARLVQANGEHEDLGMYRWAEQNLPAVVRRQLYTRISHWLRRAAHPMQHG